MAWRGHRRPGVPGVLAVLAVLGVLEVTQARVVTPEVQVQLGHVTQDEAELLVIKTNSTAGQVVVTLTRRGDSGDYQQQKEALDPDIPSERKTMLFSNLHRGTEYRICSSVRDEQQLVGDGHCFSFTTFQTRSMNRAIISGVLAAGVVAAGIALLCLLYRAVIRRKTSKTLIVTNCRENGLTNHGAELSS